jgi:glutamate carboxypeptidase
MPKCFKSGLCAIPLILAMSASSSGQHAGGLTGDERAIVQHIDAHVGDALKLLEQAVNINSGTQNFRGVQNVGRVFGAELERLGFNVRWVDGAAFKRAGHLIAEHPAAGPKLLLIGHLDTVFEADSPFQKFERVSETAARGPGIIDMKGGDVVMLQALSALKAVGALDRLNVVVVMTGDEESAGDPQDVAREALVAAAKGAIAALGFEDGAGDPRTAVIGRRGTTAWTVRV